jgi:hypothetical protein
MRRIGGFVLLGVGAFLVTMAALLKFYAYPSLAVVPLDQDSVSRSLGEGVTYFSIADREEKVDTLTSTIRVVGDVEAADEAGDNVAVWDKSTVTTTSDGTVISAETVRSAFDRTTGMQVDCCDASTDGEPTDFDGLIFKFPFNTQKQSYDFWDGDLMDTVPFHYDGEEELMGLDTYRFTQTIDPVQVGERNLPSSLVGEDPGDMLMTQEYYGNSRTYWVEPETGVIIKALEEPNSTFRYGGEDVVTATSGTTNYPDDQVQANIDEYKPLAGQLGLVRVVLPLIGLVAGIALLLGGAVLVALGRRNSERDTEQAPAGKPATES